MDSPWQSTFFLCWTISNLCNLLTFSKWVRHPVCWLRKCFTEPSFISTKSPTRPCGCALLVHAMHRYGCVFPKDPAGRTWIQGSNCLRNFWHASGPLSSDSSSTFSSSSLPFLATFLFLLIFGCFCSSPSSSTASLNLSFGSLSPEKTCSVASFKPAWLNLWLANMVLHASHSTFSFESSLACMRTKPPSSHFCVFFIGANLPAFQTTNIPTKCNAGSETLHNDKEPKSTSLCVTRPIVILQNAGPGIWEGNMGFCAHKAD